MLLDASYPDQAQNGGTTILVTPVDVRISLGEHARGSSIVVSPANAMTRSWFTFDSRVDFNQMTPNAI